jgi:hypothetical protein
MSFPLPLSQPRYVHAKILSKREVADYFWGEGERRDEEYMLHKRGICVKQKHMCEAWKGV